MKSSTEKSLKLIYERIRSSALPKLESNQLEFEPLPICGEIRWGISFVLQGKLPSDVFNKIEEVRSLIGDNHTYYDSHSLHFTIRSLEAYRGNVPPNDERVLVYKDVLKNYLGKKFTVSLRGIISTASGLLLCGYPDFNLAEMRSTLYDKLNVDDLTLSSPEPYRDKLRNTCHASIVLYGSELTDCSRYIGFLDENFEFDFGEAIELSLGLVHYIRTPNQIKVLRIS